MLITNVPADVLRAALKRQGVWLVNTRGMATEFYHKGCITIAQIQQREHPANKTGANNV